MKPRTTGSLLARSMSAWFCVCSLVIVLNLSSCANSWLIAAPIFPSMHTASKVGNNCHGSLSCAYPARDVEVCCARPGICTTITCYCFGREDGEWGLEDLPSTSMPPKQSFVGGWWSSLRAEITSWQESVASLRISSVDLEGAAVTAVKVGDVFTNVPQGKGAVTWAEDDPRDGPLVVAADNVADYASRSSGSRSNSNSAGNTPDVLAISFDKNRIHDGEKTADYHQSSEAPIKDTTIRSVVEEAGEIMTSRGESDATAADHAYRLLNAERETSRSSDSDSDGEVVFSLLTKLTAAALLSWIRCKTEGNGLVITENGRVATSDTADRRELWAAYAPTVLKLLDEVGEDPASDPELQQLYTEAIMYSTSSQGVLEAFVTGKALAFTSAMGILVKDFPTQDNGVAHIFQGSYFLAAPWPLRSPSKARESFEKSVKANGRSRRNVYYAGVGRLACGDREGAAEMFRRAASDEHCESASATERDIAAVLREQSKRGLEVCQRRTGA